MSTLKDFRFQVSASPLPRRRVRLTSDGKLLSCLFDTEYHDLKPILRNGEDDQKLAAFVREAVWKKPEGVGYMPWIKQGWKNPRNMNAIGG